MMCLYCGNRSLLSSDTFCNTCGALFPTNRRATKKKNTSRDCLLWETKQRTQSLFKTLNFTVSQFLFQPSNSFSLVSRNPDRIGPAWKYGLVIGSIGLTGSFIWAFVLHYSVFASFKHIPFGRNISSPYMLITAPIIISLQFFITAMYSSIIFRLTSRQQIPFSQVFRVICYAETPALLQMIPVLGTVTGSILWVYSLCTGLHELYKISRIRVLLTLLLPAIILITFVIIIVSAGILGGIIAESTMTQKWWSLIGH